MSKCSQVSESMPFWYVSQMYDSKMSMIKDSMTKDEKNDNKSKWLEEFTLFDLVDKFLQKDKVESS